MTRVTVKEIQVGSVLTPASGFMKQGYDYTITPYTGCSFGCPGCYVATSFFTKPHVRASWGEQVWVKVNAPDLLLREAKSGKLYGKAIYLSPNTDAYLPEEYQYQVTRQLLEILCNSRPRVIVIQTRSPLVLRDLDVIRELGSAAVVGVSISTNRDNIRKAFERRSPSIGKRIQVLRQLHDAGIQTQASLAPLLPCDAEALAELVSPHADWVVAQALRTKGSSAKTWAPGLDIVRKYQWDSWLQGGESVEQAMAELQSFLGTKFHRDDQGFNFPGRRTLPDS